MNNNRDMMTIVEKLRPVTTVDERWPAPAREAALERLLITVNDGPATARQWSRKRRVLLTAALTTGLVVSGAGIAAANGLLPESFTKRLSFWTTETGGIVDVATAQRVAQGPGPDGLVLSVWSAGRNGTTCIAPLFESPGPLDRPAPTNFHLAGGSCLDARSPAQPFGAGGGSADDHDIHMMWAAAGNAVRAELQLPDGTVRPAVPAEGLFFYWYLANDKVAAPTLVGYDSAGNVVAQWPLPNLRGPDPTRPGS